MGVISAGWTYAANLARPHDKTYKTFKGEFENWLHHWKAEEPAHEAINRAIHHGNYTRSKSISFSNHQAPKRTF
jgi:hypothetical protein